VTRFLCYRNDKPQVKYLESIERVIFDIVFLHLVKLLLRFPVEINEKPAIGYLNFVKTKRGLTDTSNSFTTLSYSIYKENEVGAHSRSKQKTEKRISIQKSDEITRRDSDGFEILKRA